MVQHVENPVIEVHDLVVSYDKKPVLWGVDFTIPRGTLVGIIGPNGAGKSTLIKSAMGLIPLSGGYVKMFGKNLAQVRDKISYVPQKESVDWDFPASVKDVVMMGRYGKINLWQKIRKADKVIVDLALQQVGMDAFADRQISQLSGGQQQRVFLARALAQQADLYWMDEPFAGVDASTEKAIIELLKKMVNEGKTVLVVHHDLQSIQSYFDWLIMLNVRLVASGPTPQVFNSNLLEETYGGKLTLLQEVQQLVKQQQMPVR